MLYILFEGANIRHVIFKGWKDFSGLGQSEKNLQIKNSRLLKTVAEEQGLEIGKLSVHNLYSRGPPLCFEPYLTLG